MSAIAQVEPMTSARALRGPFDYRLPEELREGVEVGSMLVVPFGRRDVLGVVVGLSDTSEVAEGRLLAPRRTLDVGPPALPIDLVALAGWVAAEYCSTLARALTLVLPPGATRRLGGRKPRTAIRRTTHRSVGAPAGPLPPPPNAEQAAALEEIERALASRAPERLLLHGITGSGKTEVYLRAAATTLAQGRGAIVLVPEIALTPQILTRFHERFGDTVAVIHSGLGTAERHEQWRRLRSGQARVCVGARSAVFAPVEDLGLIVLDEEHDASYKHEGDPRYDARDVAARRAEQCGAVLLAGSATPRPESWRDLRRLSLPRRVDGRPLPGVEVLDMRGESQGLHPLTAQALAEVQAARGKAIVLLNRRGWSNFLSCRSCGGVWSCPECDVALVLHRAEGHVACHHCGHREPIPRRCACGSSALARHGAGTERVEHELTRMLGDESFGVFRLDADVAQENAGGGPGGAPGGGPGALLSHFEAARAGVLIGTQMVAKGHDFPDVTLGVVLDADATLRFPDFRAEERTFALIAQLAGRVGRGGEGRVLVQTIAPQARAILHAANHDSEGFLAGELRRREALAYPPFSHLIRVICSAEQGAPAQAASVAINERLRGALKAPDTVLGPAALFRLRGRERRVLEVKARERRAAVAAVGEAVGRAAADRAHAGVSFSVDVDPQ